jgi:hypothetical protein
LERDILYTFDSKWVTERPQWALLSHRFSLSQSPHNFITNHAKTSMFLWHNSLR